MRRYLDEFLSDRRVIDTPRWLWQLLLQTVILTRRPFTSGANYRKIWNTEADESPLRTITREQATALAARLAERYGDRVVVDFAMRYGNPSTTSVIERLAGAGLRAASIFFPLYPQYSATTTATANDEAFRALMTTALAAGSAHRPGVLRPSRSTSRRWPVRSRRLTPGSPERPDVLVTSYHGMPERYLTEGDPYHCHCHKTTRLLRDAARAGLRRGRRHLPVALRPGGVAKALYRRGGRPACAGRQAADRGHGAGLRRGLRRDAGGDSRGDPAQLPRRGRRDFTYIPCLNARTAPTSR